MSASGASGIDSMFSSTISTLHDGGQSAASVARPRGGLIARFDGRMPSTAHLKLQKLSGYFGLISSSRMRGASSAGGRLRNRSRAQTATLGRLFLRRLDAHQRQPDARYGSRLLTPSGQGRGRKPAGDLVTATETIQANVASAATNATALTPGVLPYLSAMLPRTM